MYVKNKSQTQYLLNRLDFPNYQTGNVHHIASILVFTRSFCGAVFENKIVDN